MTVSAELKEKFEIWAREILALPDGEMFERLVEAAKVGLVISIKMQRSPTQENGLAVEIEMTTGEDKRDSLDWQKAEDHLTTCLKAYKELVGQPNVNPFFALGVLASIQQRFEKGERTVELYNEIMELE